MHLIVPLINEKRMNDFGHGTVYQNVEKKKIYMKIPENFSLIFIIPMKLHIIWSKILTCLCIHIRGDKGLLIDYAKSKQSRCRLKNRQKVKQ